MREFWNGSIPWFSPKDIKTFELIDSQDHVSEIAVRSSATRLVEPGSILVVIRSGVLAHTFPVGLVTQISSFNQDIKAIVPDKSLEPEYLAFFLRYCESAVVREGVKRGATVHSLNSGYLENLLIPIIPLKEQQAAVKTVKTNLLESSNALQALRNQLNEVSVLSNAIIQNSLKASGAKPTKIGECLDEIKVGIGERWSEFPVLGATRSGLAPARERPGKHADRYKPVTSGSVFYNPMRILIGSIAYVDDDDNPGITSPDYVVLKGKPGVVDSRWFYYWLRSPLGEGCIQSLARGAVRERMLFNRLAEGEIELPDYNTQIKASKALAQIKPMRAAIRKQTQELELMPRKILSKIFES